MANYTTQAINLKSYNLGEADKIIVMYSKDFGIIRCVAKGVKKTTSKLGGRMRTLVANNVFAAKGRKLDIVCQAELIDDFREITKDITKLTHAMYCAELINTFGLEDDFNSGKIYEIFFECLKNISLSSSPKEVLWTTIRFKLKLMKQLGYAVELDNCVRCNSFIHNDITSFCPESGGVVCEDCKDKLYTIIDVHHAAIRMLKDALNSDFIEDAACSNKIVVNCDGLTYNHETLLNSCFNLLKKYVNSRSHKKLKTPELIESLC